MTEPRQIFTTLRDAVAADLPPGTEVPNNTIPLEQTYDGWYVITRVGKAVHRDRCGVEEELPLRLQVALVGRLSRRYPLATWFLPGPVQADVCTGCNGSGTLGRAAVADVVVCRCGGLGWIPQEG